MPERMVTANLSRSVGLRGGRLYGPGRGIQIPESLATALGIRASVVPEPEPAVVSVVMPVIDPVAPVIGSGLGGGAAETEVLFTPAGLAPGMKVKVRDSAGKPVPAPKPKPRAKPPAKKPAPKKGK